VQHFLAFYADFKAIKNTNTKMHSPGIALLIIMERTDFVYLQKLEGKKEIVH